MYSGVGSANNIPKRRRENRALVSVTLEEYIVRPTYAKGESLTTVANL